MFYAGLIDNFVNLKFDDAILNFLHIRSTRSDGKMQFMRLGRALAAPAAAHSRDVRAQQAFMRIGRSAPGGSKPSMYTRIGRAPAPAGVYTRIGRSAAAEEDGEDDDIYARDTRSPADMYTRLGRAPQLYTRIGRAAPNKQQMYMRIGRAGGAANQFMRIGRAANKQFMRIGRAGASRQFTRIGRAANQQFMRLGRAPQLYTRIGRSYFRTGRASHLYTRLVQLQVAQLLFKCLVYNFVYYRLTSLL